MRFEDLSEFLGETIIIKFSTNEPVSILKDSLVRITNVGGSYVISSLVEPNKQAIIKFSSNVEKTKVDKLIEKQYIANLYSNYDNDIEIHAIMVENCENAQFPIYISQKLSNQKKGYSKFVYIFKKYYCFECGTKKYCIIGRHKNSKDDDAGFVFANKEKRLVIKSKKKSELSAEDKNYISEINEDESDFNVLYADSEIPNRHYGEYVYSLAEMNVVFCDTLKNMAYATEAITFSKSNGIGEYLQKWNEYNEREYFEWNERAAQAGIVNYTDIKKNAGNSYELIFDKDENTQRKLDKFIKVMNESRNYAIEIPITVKEYGEETVKQFQFEVMKAAIKSGNRFIITPMKDKTPRPHKAGNISFSIRGYLAQYKKRKAVFELIEEGGCKMPQLPKLLSGETSMFSRSNIKHHDPITPDVLRIFGKYPPNDRQKEAINVAINTPDWAIIQGPPGTGKTTVIAAIAQRLNDVDVSRKVNFGFADSLMTAYQNDATENMSKKVRIHGLPTPKMDNKKESRVIEKSVQEWIEEKKDELNKKYANIDRNLSYKQLKRIEFEYDIKNTTYDENISLLDTLETSLSNIIGDDLITKLTELKKEAIRERNKRDSDNKNKIYFASKLPVREESFLDNGLEVFYEVKLQLNGYDCEVFLQELEKIYFNTPVDFEKARSIRAKLISYLLPRNEALIPSTEYNKRVFSFIKEIQSNNNVKLDKEEIIIEEYVNAFNSSQIEISDSIRKFYTIIGATHQFSASKHIREMKEAMMSAEGFDTVFFDEAARSTPHDMLIPMTQAKEKLIIVGDHKQLPPIIDNEIVNYLVDNCSQKSYADYKEVKRRDYYETMFEHMANVSKELYQKDHFVRVVKLDTQYRMHPQLGDLISRNFYEKGPDGFVLHSGRPETDFEHSLPGIENKCMVWIDAPYTKEDEAFRGVTKSYERPVEAVKTAKFLKELMDSNEGKSMTFGVVAFYTAQIEQINEALVKEGIFVKKDDSEYNNEYVLSDKYDKFVNGQEKIKVGTVDSFQGLEFDVVILSMVRSTSNPMSAADYGHLVSEERLCVSLSRQKKCLVVVGDSHMVSDENQVAKKCVPALAEFYDICRREDNIYGTIKNISDTRIN